MAKSMTLKGVWYLCEKLKDSSTVCGKANTHNITLCTLTKQFFTLISWSLQWNCCHLCDRRVHLIPSQEREQCQMAEYSSRDSGQVVDRHPPSEYTDILADCQQTACGM